MYCSALTSSSLDIMEVSSCRLWRGGRKRERERERGRGRERERERERERGRERER